MQDPLVSFAAKVGCRPPSYLTRFSLGPISLRPRPLSFLMVQTPCCLFFPRPNFWGRVCMPWLERGRIATTNAFCILFVNARFSVVCYSTNVVFAPFTLSSECFFNNIIIFDWLHDLVSFCSLLIFSFESVISWLSFFLLIMPLYIYFVLLSLVIVWVPFERFIILVFVCLSHILFFWFSHLCNIFVVLTLLNWLIALKVLSSFLDHFSLFSIMFSFHYHGCFFFDSSCLLSFPQFSHFLFFTFNAHFVFLFLFSFPNLPAFSFEHYFAWSSFDKFLSILLVCLLCSCGFGNFLLLSILYMFYLSVIFLISSPLTFISIICVIFSFITFPVYFLFSSHVGIMWIIFWVSQYSLFFSLLSLLVVFVRYSWV